MYIAFDIRYFGEIYLLLAAILEGDLLKLVHYVTNFNCIAYTLRGNDKPEAYTLVRT